MSALEDINSAEQTADYLKISVDALKRLAYQKKIGSLKQGRTLTFPRAVVEAYVEANVSPATPANPFGLTDASLRRVRKTA